jgi:hypothetical protein
MRVCRSLLGQRVGKFVRDLFQQVRGRAATSRMNGQAAALSVVPRACEVRG